MGSNDLIIYHRALTPNTLYSFKFCCVYKDICTTTPVYITNIETGDATTESSSTTTTITDFENDRLSFACHCCCYCSITDDEDSIDLHHGDFTILAIDDKNRMIKLLSPSKSLTRTIPINMICNMYFIEQDNEKGLVLLVLSILYSIIHSI